MYVNNHCSSLIIFPTIHPNDKVRVCPFCNNIHKRENRYPMSFYMDHVDYYDNSAILTRHRNYYKFLEDNFRIQYCDLVFLQFKLCQQDLTSNFQLYCNALGGLDLSYYCYVRKIGNIRFVAFKDFTHLMYLRDIEIHNFNDYVIHKDHLIEKYDLKLLNFVNRYFYRDLDDWRYNYLFHFRMVEKRFIIPISNYDLFLYINNLILYKEVQEDRKFPVPILANIKLYSTEYESIFNDYLFRRKIYFFIARLTQNMHHQIHMTKKGHPLHCTRRAPFTRFHFHNNTNHIITQQYSSINTTKNRVLLMLSDQYTPPESLH